MSGKRVIECCAADLDWSFEDDRPHVKLGATLPDCWPQKVPVYPFPCYGHDPKLVRTTLRAVEGAVRIKNRPYIYVLAFDTPHQTNGWAQCLHRFEGPGWHGLIVLAGKRIPPHPAVTRYLVAHEYGHHVEWECLRARGLDVNGSDIRDEYGALRGLDPGVSTRYGGGRWHSNVGELFANDFRILVAGVEPDYWPHPRYQRPERLKRVVRWWEENAP